MFRFADPEYLFLLLLIPFLIGIYLLTALQNKRRLRKFGDPRLLIALVPAYSRRKPLVKFVLLLSALITLIVLLARPQNGLTTTSENKKGIEVAVMLDVSNSMLAQDVSPNRLERAKLLVSTLIDRMQNDKIALGVFAGEAYPQLPITGDYGAAKLFLNSITPGMVTLQGTNLAAAINLADKSFTDKKRVGKAIIIITDGEDHQGGAEEAAAAAAKEGQKVYILGIGNPGGAQIPLGNDYLKDNNGQVVVTKLNEQMCREVAKAGNGLYLHVDNSNAAQEQLQTALGQLQQASEHTDYTSYNEQFQAIALILLLLLFIESFVCETKNPWVQRWHLFNRKQ